MAAVCSYGFELTCEARVVDLFDVKKYKSSRTGLTVCMANVSGPLVNGYFCVGMSIRLLNYMLYTGTGPTIDHYLKF